jgi:hypothetical protein
MAYRKGCPVSPIRPNRYGFSSLPLNLQCSHKKSLEHGFIRREELSAICNPPEFAVDTLYLHRIPEIRHKPFPISSPGFDNMRILADPFLLKSLHRTIGFLKSRCSINSL